MKLCSFQVDLRLLEELSEWEQDQLLEAVDALNLPHRLRLCVRATLDRCIDNHCVKVTVEE